MINFKALALFFSVFFSLNSHSETNFSFCYGNKITLNCWKRISPQTKSFVLRFKNKFPEILKEDFEGDEIVKAGLKEDSKKLETLVLENAYNDYIEDSIHSIEGIFSVEKPFLYFLTTYKLEGKMIAAETGLIQHGGATKNGQAPKQFHYETNEAALKDENNDLGSDVSWQINSSFSFEKNSWKLLQIDTLGETGGWHWTGF